MVSIELFKTFVEVDNYSLRDDVTGTLSDNFTLEIDTENILIITTKDYNGNVCNNKNVTVHCNKGGFRRIIRNNVEEDVSTHPMTIFEYFNKDEVSGDDFAEYQTYCATLPPRQDFTSTTDNNGQLRIVYYADEWGFCTITVNEVTFQVYVTGWRTETGHMLDGSPSGIVSEIGTYGLNDLKYFVDESIRHIIIYGRYGYNEMITNIPQDGEEVYDSATVYGNMNGKRLKTSLLNEYSEEEYIFPYRPPVAKRTLTYTPDIVWYINSVGEIKVRALGYDNLPIPQSVRIAYDLTYPFLDGREV